MNRLVLSAVAAAALAGSAFTYNAIAATSAPDAPGAAMKADAGFMFEAKLAGMKAALKLTPDQEKLWPAFETAVRDAHAARMSAMREHRDEMEKGERPSPIAVMSEMSERLGKASQELKQVADAAKPLYDSLDEMQKRHFGPLVAMLREQGPHGWGPHGEHGSEQGPKPL
jgi:Spy/CpxP family protein refolding chaperone